MIKSYKYRLKPNKTQADKLQKTLATCRYLYNQSLDQRITYYKEHRADIQKESGTKVKKSLSSYDQMKWLTNNKNEYQKQVHSQVLQDVSDRLERAFKVFYKYCKNLKAYNKGELSKRPKKVGFPRFKSWTRYRSFCYKQSGFKLKEDTNKIQLSKIGDVKLIYSRPIEGEIKNCRILKDVDQWYVILICETENKPFVSNNKPQVGIDVGLTKLAAITDGQHEDNPRFLRKSEYKLKKEQRRLSRKVKGSKNRNKQRIKVARVHRKIRRQRLDHLHKLSSKLVKSYSFIGLEDLNIKGMMKNHKLAKSISDVSWGMLISLMISKAANAGSIIEQVDPKNTTQNCSGCGEKVPKELKDRIHCCPHCGLVMDRDDNASLNILNRALAQWESKSRAGSAQTATQVATLTEAINIAEVNMQSTGCLVDRDKTTTLRNDDLEQVLSLK